MPVTGGLKVIPTGFEASLGYMGANLKTIPYWDAEDYCEFKAILDRMVNSASIARSSLERKGKGEKPTKETNSAQGISAYGLGFSSERNLMEVCLMEGAP